MSLKSFVVILVALAVTMIAVVIISGQDSQLQGTACVAAATGDVQFSVYQLLAAIVVAAACFGVIRYVVISEERELKARAARRATMPREVVSCTPAVNYRVEAARELQAYLESL